MSPNKSLPTMDQHADATHPVKRPESMQDEQKRLQKGKPFQEKMVPMTGAQTLSGQMNKFGKMLGEANPAAAIGKITDALRGK